MKIVGRDPLKPPLALNVWRSEQVRPEIVCSVAMSVLEILEPVKAGSAGLREDYFAR